MNNECRSRRRVLRSGALGLAVVLSGCGGTNPGGPTGTPGQSPTATQDESPPTATREPTDTPSETPRETPTEYPTETPVDPPPGTRLDADTAFFKTTYMNEKAIEGGIGDDDREYYATLVTTEAETDRFNRSVLDDETVAFVEATAFPDWILLVAQRELPSSSLGLGLGWAVLEDGTLVANVVTTPRYLTEAEANATLVARLDLDGHPIPEPGSVTFLDRNGEQTDVEIDYTENS